MNPEPERGQQAVPSTVTPPLPPDPPAAPPVGRPVPVDHLAEAKMILATARTLGTAPGWDVERLAAAQVHAIIALTEAVVAHGMFKKILDAGAAASAALAVPLRLNYDFGPPPPAPGQYMSTPPEETRPQ